MIRTACTNELLVVATFCFCTRKLEFSLSNKCTREINWIESSKFRKRPTPISFVQLECIKFQKRTFYHSWLQICANTFEVKAPLAQLVPPIQEAFSKNRTDLYATNKYKKSGPMLYLIIHTHDVNTEGTKTIVPTYTSSKKTKKRFKKDINNSVLKYFRNCAVETQRWGDMSVYRNSNVAKGGLKAKI